MYSSRYEKLWEEAWLLLLSCGPDEEDIIHWLNGIIAKGIEYLPMQELRYKAIFPNQKGQLKAEQWMVRYQTPDDV